MADLPETRFVDLSHVITDGKVTYRGLPSPHICDYWTREQSAANYDDGSTFQIGRIDMVANTGTGPRVRHNRLARLPCLPERYLSARFSAAKVAPPYRRRTPKS